MAHDTTATTAQGRVRGVLEDGRRIWRGIPYATPPVGELRFRPPQPPRRWQGVRTAIDLGHEAWQSPMVNPVTGEPNVLHCDEDCLVLNVTAPADPPPEHGYPVLFWVHGGGYVLGSGPDMIGDGSALARQGIVVVTCNYRLGSLGFLHLADVLGTGSADSGSAGLLDQVAALQWVHANISAFGGDPDQVTLYGISAGAKSVANLLASPLTGGLVRGAISGSGGADHVANPDQATRLRRRFFEVLGIGDDHAATLWTVPPDELVAAQEVIASGARGTWVWRPVVGGSAIPIPPLEAIASGAAPGVPLLVGNNGNEGASYQLMDPTAAEQAPRVLTELFGPDDAKAMLDAYPAARPDLDEIGIQLAVLGDERYGVPTRRLALAQAHHGPVWRYRYDGCPPGVPRALSGGHGIDGMAVFAAESFRPQAEAGDAEARLCVAMAAAFTRFAVHGSPDGPDGETLLPPWSPFQAADERTMVLSPEPHMEEHPRLSEYAIWDGRTWPSGTWWPVEGL